MSHIRHALLPHTRPWPYIRARSGPTVHYAIMVMRYGSVSHVCLPDSITLWYPHINPFRLCHVTLVWYSECYSGMPQSHQYTPLQCNIMVPSNQSIMVTLWRLWYPSILLWYDSFLHISHTVLPPSSLRTHTIPKGHVMRPTALTLWYRPSHQYISFMLTVL